MSASYVRLRPWGYKSWAYMPAGDVDEFTECRREDYEIEPVQLTHEEYEALPELSGGDW
jgi:hypothetical protein